MTTMSPGLSLGPKSWARKSKNMLPFTCSSTIRSARTPSRAIAPIKFTRLPWSGRSISGVLPLGAHPEVRLWAVSMPDSSMYTKVVAPKPVCFAMKAFLSATTSSRKAAFGRNIPFFGVPDARHNLRHRLWRDSYSTL